MKLIVGLGNPGTKYERTRHSLGFEFAKVLADKSNSSFSLDKNLKAEITKTRIGDEEVIIAKPQTYMNLSGESVKAIMNYYKISSKDIVVASDDTYLEAGILRIRFGGTSGGHNGLKSVIEAIGPDFWRVRLGIGPNGNIPLEDFVLTRIPGEQEKLMTSMIDKAVLEMISFLSDKKFENKTIN